jgi:crotonobetainyl-CoA:carnitine CoA-transferase CaiB-like acyl-CoA transferase
MSESETGSLRPPPSLGADGPDVLRALGYDGDAIARLLDAGVLYTRERLVDGG